MTLDLLSTVSFEKSFQSQQLPMQLNANDIHGIAVIVHIEAAEPPLDQEVNDQMEDESFCCMLIGKKEIMDPKGSSSLEGLCQGLAMRLRADLYQKGFAAPQNELNDFPSAAYQFSKDVVASQIALKMPQKWVETHTHEQMQTLLVEVAHSLGHAIFREYHSVTRPVLSRDFQTRVFEQTVNDSIQTLSKQTKPFSFK